MRAAPQSWRNDVEFVCIYEIKNIVDFKRYIGSTTDVSNRWKCHRSNLRSGIHHSRHLQGAWNKYGEENFSFKVLERCPPDQRIVREQFWIDRCRCYLPKFGYNICRYAESVIGRKHSEETRRKISESNKGKIRSPEHCRRLSEVQRGKQVSDETRAKLSVAGKGRVFSKESVRKSVEARRGYKASEETRQKMREKALGRRLSEETKKKLSIAGTGRKWTTSQRLKMLSIERKPLTIEQRKKQSKSRGGKPFIVITPSKENIIFYTLKQAAETLGLDASNIHKCLIGKANATKGYSCKYKTP